MESKFIQQVTLYSGIGSIITAVGYIIEKVISINSNIPYGIIFLPLFFTLIVFGLILVYLSIKRFQIEDISASYEFKIFNLDGDTTITRRVTFSVNDDMVHHREHTVYSDGATAEMAEFNLKAWDDSGKELFCKVTLDKPTMKKYEVHFPQSIPEDNKFTYTDQFSWKRLLNVKNDYWLMSDSSKDVDFSIVIDKSWQILSIATDEVFIDGTTKKIKSALKNKKAEDLNFIKYNYKVDKQERHTKVKVEWNIITN